MDNEQSTNRQRTDKVHYGALGSRRNKKREKWIFLFVPDNPQVTHISEKVSEFLEMDIKKNDMFYTLWQGFAWAFI